MDVDMAPLETRAFAVDQVSNRRRQEAKPASAAT